MCMGCTRQLDSLYHLWIGLAQLVFGGLVLMFLKAGTGRPLIL